MHWVVDMEVMLEDTDPSSEMARWIKPSIFSMRGFCFLGAEIRSDMILMENQLPLLVLQRILVVQQGISSPVRTVLSQIFLFVHIQIEC